MNELIHRYYIQKKAVARMHLCICMCIHIQCTSQKYFNVFVYAVELIRTETPALVRSELTTVSTTVYLQHPFSHFKRPPSPFFTRVANDSIVH